MTLDFCRFKTTVHRCPICQMNYIANLELKNEVARLTHVIKNCQKFGVAGTDSFLGQIK
jgi:hypothetical protein